MRQIISLALPYYGNQKQIPVPSFPESTVSAPAYARVADIASFRNDFLFAQRRSMEQFNALFFFPVS